MNPSARFPRVFRSPFGSLSLANGVAGLVALFLLRPAPSSAQSVWIDRGLGPAVWAEGFIGPMTGARALVECPRWDIEASYRRRFRDVE